jgi:hypothetical protein
MSTSTTDKPRVKLLKRDGNAFAILGRCFDAARKAGWTQAQRDEFSAKATAGDYHELLRVVNEYFDVR